jgi:gluconate 2-dehydrogenase gamma chain
MRKHDEARRAFLVGAVAGAGVIAGDGIVPPALAQKAEAIPPAAPAHMHTPGAGLGAFLNVENAATITAFTERIMPGAPGRPGATDAGVLNYIDLALAGAYADQQDFYRRGLASLDTYCRTIHNRPFTQLAAAQQDEVIKALEDGMATGFTWPSAQAFFNTVRVHTIEGMFSDPVYGGNKDFAGWRLVGFPGAQPQFTPADMQSREAYAGTPIIGLQAQTPMRRG